MVYSRPSHSDGFVVEWAKNRAANRSPTPVNTIPLPISGILIVCLVFVVP